MDTLTDDDVLRLRMESLLLGAKRLATPLEIATWFGAMQAQDLASGKWSFGLRLPGSTEADIDAAIESGQVLRTWPMRGTIHFVPATDASWMLTHTGVKALAGAARRREFLGLDLATVDRAAEVLSAELQGGKRLSRTAAVSVLNNAGITTTAQRAYHIIWYVSQIAVTCIGPNEGREQTIVLLDEWAGPPRTLDRRQGLAELALRYFRSHGPTSRQDFMGWAGINAKEAQVAIHDNEPALACARHRDREFWMLASLPDSVSPASHATGNRAAARVLPGFDEYLLGYKDRSLMFADAYKTEIMPGGGIFRPTIVADGRVIGTWRRSTRKARVDVTTIPFAPLTSSQETSLGEAFRDYGEYLQQPVAVKSAPFRPVSA